MDILWAPWREKYIKLCGLKKDGCIFCQILKDNKDAKHFIFMRSAHAFAVLNIYPFNGGHALVLPQRHVGFLEKLTPEERVDLMDALIKVQDMMKKAFSPHAFNVGMNMGHLAGAGIPEHLHVHIVPRWSGDVNFMPALFGTKIIPVSLDDIYESLIAAKEQEPRENKARDRKKRK